MPAPPPKKPGSPEENDWKKRVLIWAFVILAIVGMGWAIYAAPKQKQLVCKNTGGQASLHAFGTCTEE